MRTVLRAGDVEFGEEDRGRGFVPLEFQRLGDTDNTTGVGLGLAPPQGSPRRWAAPWP